MRRISQLDGLRGIAVLLVFVYHALHVPLCWAGVDLFFVLSGYLITGILLHLKETRSAGGYWRPFYARRLRRIVPPYLGFIAVVSLFFAVPWRNIWYWYCFGIANIAGAFGKDIFRPFVPLWSLAAEEQFYLVWPLVVLLASPRILKRIAIGIIVGAPLLRMLFTPVFSKHTPIYCLTPFRADLLACGALIAVCGAPDPQWNLRRRRAAAYTFVAAGSVLLGLSVLHRFRLTANSVLFNGLAYSLIVAIFGSALIQTLTLTKGPLHALLTARPLRFMGTISYTFYLYQAPVIQKIGTRGHSPLATATAAFAVTGLISAVSWRFFESPILKSGLRTDGPKLFRLPLPPLRARKQPLRERVSS